jgi:stage V sporulation protein B
LYFIKGILHNDYLTGIYNSALMVARIPYYLFYALTIILLPSVSSFKAKLDHEGARKVVYDSLRFMIILLVPIVVLLFSFSAAVIKFIFGAKYLEGTLSLEILTFGIGLLTVFYILSFAINGAGKVKIPMWIAFGGMIFNAVMNYFMVTHWGIVGSAIATSIASFLVMIVSLVYSHRYFRGVIRLKSLSKVLLAGAVILTLSWFTSTSSWLFIPLGLFYFGLYFLILFLLKELDGRDLEIFRKILNKNKPSI